MHCLCTMFELKTAAILLLILTVATTPSAGLVEEAIDIIKLGKDVTVSILETWDIIEQTHMVNEVDIPFYKKKEKKILSRMTELSRKIDMAELEVSKFARQFIYDWVRDYSVEINKAREQCANFIHIIIVV